MKCTLDYDKILAYRLGELSGTGAEEVERHIASCPGCARELKAMDGILGGLAGLPRLEPDTARWVELRGAIEHKRRPGVVRLLSMLAHRLKRPAVAMVA
ncbi:MAG: zf-HC2 domain-containing protein, partial [bacterium]